MRLLSLSEHKEKNDDYMKMWHDFLLEQGLKAEEGMNHHERFLIEHGGALIGFAEAKLEEECFPDEDLPEVCLKIYAFYICPEAREKNLGRQAFKLLREYGRDNKAALLETEVSKALKFSNDFFKEQGLELAGSGVRNIWRGFI